MDLGGGGLEFTCVTCILEMFALPTAPRVDAPRVDETPSLPDESSPGDARCPRCRLRNVSFHAVVPRQLGRMISLPSGRLQPSGPSHDPDGVVTMRSVVDNATPFGR